MSRIDVGGGAGGRTASGGRQTSERATGRPGATPGTCVVTFGSEGSDERSRHVRAACGKRDRGSDCPVRVSFHGASWDMEEGDSVPPRHGTTRRRILVIACRSGCVSLSYDEGGRRSGPVTGAGKVGLRERAEVRAGDVAVVPSGIDFAVAPDDGTQFACVEIDPTAMCPCRHSGRGQTCASTCLAPALARFERGKERPVVIRQLFDDDLRVLIKRIAFEQSGEAPRHPRTLAGMVGDLLSRIDGALAPAPEGSLCLARVLDYVDREYATASLRGAADELFCHPNSVSNLVKRELGMTFGELVTSVRLDRAARLLETDDLTVQCVAGACGYHNLTHFYEVFRARYNMSPGEYRDAYGRRAG
jgi:AraC-like DNA-binding protein